MSEQSLFREPTPDEVKVLRRLTEMAAGLRADWLDGLQVADMDDGGMGSLRLVPMGTDGSRSAKGEPVAHYEYLDADDVVVLVQLFVDERGVPVELDSWKVDFEPILSRGT